MKFKKTGFKKLPLYRPHLGSVMLTRMCGALSAVHEQQDVLVEDQYVSGTRACGDCHALHSHERFLSSLR